MMSPKMKKILLIGGAAVVGLIAYKVIRKRPAQPTSVTQPKIAIATRLAMLPQAQFAKIAASEDLGSLGSSWR
jgi:hypothetical protein